MANAAQLAAKLEKSLQATHVDVVDNSWQHQGHRGYVAGETTHIQVIVVSPLFEGKHALDRHRMVHDVLKEDRDNGLHAIEIKTYTPTAWQGQAAS